MSEKITNCRFCQIGVEVDDRNMVIPPDPTLGYACAFCLDYFQTTISSLVHSEGSTSSYGSEAIHNLRLIVSWQMQELGKQNLGMEHPLLGDYKELPSIPM